MNLSSLSNISSGIQTLSNLIMVNPQSPKGIQAQPATGTDGTQQPQDPKFLFHYEGEQTFLMESDITDHPAEDNKALQNQIALRPETITTRGYIGELNNVIPDALAPIAAQVQTKLTEISAYTPQLSITALLAFNEAFQAYQIAQAAAAATASTLSLFGSGSSALSAFANQNKQQSAFQMFYGYWKKRTLFTVQTPWGVFKDMALKSCRAVQSEDTDTITDFELTFKQMRFANTLDNTINLTQGRLIAQSSSMVNNGLSTPIQTSGLFDANGPGASLLG